MIYEIMNREDAQLASFEPEAPTTVIISITDPGSDKNCFRQHPWLKDILHLQFFDTEEYERSCYECINEEQAKKIAKFAIKFYPYVERFIIHCEYGISRSSGVAAALDEYFENVERSRIFDDDIFVPNRTCHSLVLKALNSKSDNDINYCVDLGPGGFLYQTKSISDLFNQGIVGHPRMYLEFEEFEKLMKEMKPGEWVHFSALIIYKYVGDFNPDDFEYAKKNRAFGGAIMRRKEDA